MFVSYRHLSCLLFLCKVSPITAVPQDVWPSYGILLLYYSKEFSPNICPSENYVIWWWWCLSEIFTFSNEKITFSIHACPQDILPIVLTFLPNYFTAFRFRSCDCEIHGHTWKTLGWCPFLRRARSVSNVSSVSSVISSFIFTISLIRQFSLSSVWIFLLPS